MHRAGLYRLACGWTYASIVCQNTNDDDNDEDEDDAAVCKVTYYLLIY